MLLNVISDQNLVLFSVQTFSFISGVVIRTVVVIINADHTEDNTDDSRRPNENI